MERRHGMTAKIYSVMAPVIAAKLHDDGHMVADTPITTIKDSNISDFFQPFVDGGTLNANIIIGNPDEHGRFDTRSKEGSYFSDFAILIGSFIRKHSFPYHKIDTEITDSDLKENLIILGNHKTNTVIDRLKDHLPISFLENDQSFISKNTKKVYKDPRTGFVIKIKNPFNPEKSIMVIGGIRTRGARAAIIALTQNIEELCANQENGADFIRVVKGLDREGRGLIDSAEFLE